MVNRRHIAGLADAIGNVGWAGNENGVLGRHTENLSISANRSILKLCYTRRFHNFFEMFFRFQCTQYFPCIIIASGFFIIYENIFHYVIMVPTK